MPWKTWLCRLACLLFAVPALGAIAEKPNIVFILADDLGYGDLGCYGQREIRTPHLDRMAAEGLRFTRFYAGSTVCAPSRSVLMTGLHTGHTRVRGNGGGNTSGGQTLRDEDVTVAEVLHQAGYTTALIGKWGLGEPPTSGAPHKQGFDYFFGYTNQTHAHNHFPSFLWRQTVKISLPNDLVPVGAVEGAGYASQPKVYASDLFADEAAQFIDRHADGAPFFLFLSAVLPHANNERRQRLGNGAEVPNLGEYADSPWSEPTKGYAAMVSRLDAHVGRVLAKLKERGLEERTIVFFASDNGPHAEDGRDQEVTRSSGPLRGRKRDLTEGGIRVPMIVRWPGRVPAGVTTDFVASFQDFLATAAELAGIDPPAGLDSISLVPVLTGREADQPAHPFLYWEFYERGFDQAVLMDGRWKAIRLSPRAGQTPTPERSGRTQLYDLMLDPGETCDLAAEHPDRVARAEALFRREHVPNDDWPPR